MKSIKSKIFILLIPVCFFLFLMLILSLGIMIGGGGDDSSSSSGTAEQFTGKFTKDLPDVGDIKGKGQIDDEIAQYAVATAIKYRLLPSVILSQYAYESEWGKSQSAKEDNNYFGVTWFQGAPYPKGSSRGVGGSEGGNYMKFPNDEEAFNYYGYMLASQDNFSDSVGNKSPDDVLLTLGEGGYAAAGITKSSPYFTGAMGIIEDNDLKGYDKPAIEKWDSKSESKSSKASGNNSDVLEIAEEFEGHMSYSQPMRTNLGTPEKPDKSGNADCASFVWLMLGNAGYEIPKTPYTTVTMADDAKGDNQFLEEIDKDEAGPGDVVIVNMGSGTGNNGHTAILLEDWQGKDTDIIQIGGVEDKVNKDQFGTSFMSLLSGSETTLASPVK